MKKILSLIIALVLVLMVGACSPTSNTDLENRVKVLEEQVEVLNGFYESVIPTVGLNGQTDYYVNYNSNQYMSLMSYTLMSDKTEKDYLDKSKFPDYIWDDNGEYVSIKQLDTLLANKYFGSVYGTIFETGSQYHFIFNLDTDMSNEEFIVRLSMMILELAEYDFYTIDSSELHIYALLNNSPVEITIRMMLLIEDKYDLHPAIFWNGLLDTQIDGITYNKTNLETMYQEYITNETFSGYVLPNYN